MPKEYQHKTIAGFFAAHRDRWIKGSYEKNLKRGGEEVSCFCLLGKIQQMEDNEEERQRMYNRTRDAIKTLHPTIFKRITKNENDNQSIIFVFNDAQNRTIDEIIEVAREARI